LQTATTATRFSLQGASFVRMSDLTIQQRFDAFVQLTSADAVVTYGPIILQCPYNSERPRCYKW
jgi:hypothetical protein